MKDLNCGELVRIVGKPYGEYRSSNEIARKEDYFTINSIQNFNGVACYTTTGFAWYPATSLTVVDPDADAKKITELKNQLTMKERWEKLYINSVNKESVIVDEYMKNTNDLIAIYEAKIKGLLMILHRFGIDVVIMEVD